MKGRKPDLIAVDGGLTNAPPPPAWMSDEAKAEWNRVAPDLIERRILSETDLGGLESYCVAIGRVRECEHLLRAADLVVETDNFPRKHPAFSMQMEAMKTARQFAAELGLTPVSRTRVSVAAQNEDEFAGLVAG